MRGIERRKLGQGEREGKEWGGGRLKGGGKKEVRDKGKNDGIRNVRKKIRTKIKLNWIGCRKKGRGGRVPKKICR